jgi:hypothetical protein
MLTTTSPRQARARLISGFAMHRIERPPAYGCPGTSVVNLCPLVGPSARRSRAPRLCAGPRCPGHAPTCACAMRRRACTRPAGLLTMPKTSPFTSSSSPCLASCTRVLCFPEVVAPSCSPTACAATVQCSTTAKKLSLAPSQGRRPSFSFSWSSSTPPGRCSSTKPCRSRTPSAATGARGAPRHRRPARQLPARPRPPPAQTRSVAAQVLSSSQVRPPPAANPAAGEVQTRPGTQLL